MRKLKERISELFNGRISINFPRWEFILFTVILCVNCLLKLYGISDETIYGDEAYSIIVSNHPLTWIIDNFKNDQNPPFYFILLHAWIQITGVSDISLKLLSVIISILTLVALYFFARRNFGVQAAVFAVLLFTFSNGQEFFAREIRGFALTQLLVMMSFWFYFLTLEKPRYRYTMALLIVNLLLLLTHYITVFIPLLQGIFSFFRLKKNKRGVYFYWGGQVAALLLFLPWVRIVMKNMPEQGSYWITAPDWVAAKVTAMELVGSEQLRNIIIWFLIAVFITWLASLVFKKIFKDLDHWKFLLLFAWILVPFFGVYFISQVFPIFFYRYLLYITLGVYLLAGYFFSTIRVHKLIQTAFFLVLLYFHVSAYHVIPNKGDDWKELVPKIERIQNDSTAVLVSAPYKTNEFSFYYDLEAFKNNDALRTRLLKRNVFAFDNNVIDWNLLDTTRFTKLIFVQSHHSWYDPEDKLGSQLVSAGYIRLWEYQKVEGNWMSAKIICYSNRLSHWFNTDFISQINPDSSSCEAWTRSMEVAYPNMDTMFHVSSGFELPDRCSQYVNITRDQVFKGYHATYSDSVQPYSYSFIDSAKNLPKKRFLFGSAYVYCSDSLSKAGIVVQVEKGNNGLDQFQFSCQPDGKNKWKLITFYADLKNPPKDAVIKVFLFSNMEKVWMDDINLYFADEFF